MRWEGGHRKLSIYTMLFVHRWLGRSKMTPHINAWHFHGTTLWSDIQVISPTKCCMCIDASINMHLHQASQPILCIQRKFLIKKALLRQVTSVAVTLMSVPEFKLTVSTLGFTRVSRLFKMMKALRNGLTVELHNDEFTTNVFSFSFFVKV